MENQVSISDLMALLSYAKKQKEEAPDSEPSPGHSWDDDIKQLEASIAYSYQMTTRKLYNRY